MWMVCFPVTKMNMSLADVPGYPSFAVGQQFESKFIGILAVQFSSYERPGGLASANALDDGSIMDVAGFEPTRYEKLWFFFKCVVYVLVQSLQNRPRLPTVGVKFLEIHFYF